MIHLFGGSELLGHLLVADSLFRRDTEAGGEAFNLAAQNSVETEISRGAHVDTVKKEPAYV